MEFLLRGLHAGAFTLRFFNLPRFATDSHFIPIATFIQWFSVNSQCVSLASLMFISIFSLLLLCLHYYYSCRCKNRIKDKLISMENGNVSRSLGGCGSQFPEQIFILSGQSNMSGRGGVQTKHHSDGSTFREWDHVVPAECHYEKGKIWCLNAKLDWVEAHEPLHHDIDLGKVCGLGPGLVFAASVLQHGKTVDQSAPTIGLVPCAIGGTQIKEWEKGSKLYERMIHRAKCATAKSGTIKAILWYQGESDTYSPHNVKEFPERLESLFTNIRQDLENDALPIIQVGITAKDHPHPEYLEEVRQAQRALKMQGVYYVDANGLPLLGDDIHLNTHAQVQLGKWLADTYLDSVQSCH